MEPNTVLSFYNGKRLRPRSWEDRDHDDWAENAYKIFDPSLKNQTIDIPKLYRFKKVTFKRALKFKLTENY